MANLMDEFDKHVSGIAWSLWRELGVAGIDRFHEDCLVQPEELIILTALVSKYDPRLFDEALDWTSRYHHWISISRLRVFLKELDASSIESFIQFASALNAVSKANWLNLDAMSPVPKLSGKSVLPPLESPALLVFRLRNLFGLGAKADILTSYLTRNRMQFSAADLVDVGYSKRSLMIALDHLAASEILTVSNVRNAKKYALKKSRELQVLIGKLPKFAPPWIKILQAITAIRLVIPEIQNSRSEMTRGVILRNCLTRIESLLPFFLSPILHHNFDFKQDWKAVLDMFKAFQQGNFSMQYEVYDEFDKIVIHLLRNLHQLDDCIDGIEMIDSEMVLKPNRHDDIYKKCYQLFLRFIDDLNISLKQFFDFPIHKMMSEPLADVFYQFSKEKLPELTKILKQMKKIDEVNNAQTAIRQYQIFMPECDALRQFIYTFSEQLKALYFIKTNIHLLTLPTTLYKRHLVLELFAEAGKTGAD